MVAPHLPESLSPKSVKNPWKWGDAGRTGGLGHHASFRASSIGGLAAGAFSYAMIFFRTAYSTISAVLCKFNFCIKCVR